MADLTQLTAKELIERIPDAVNPEKIAGMDAVIQISLSGDGGGDWMITVKDSKCQVEEGTAEKPRVTLSAKAQEFRNVVSGKSNPMQAFMLGRIKISGDLNFAMKLQSLFGS